MRIQWKFVQPQREMPMRVGKWTVFESCIRSCENDVSDLWIASNRLRKTVIWYLAMWERVGESLQQEGATLCHILLLAENHYSVSFVTWGVQDGPVINGGFMRVRTSPSHFFFPPLRPCLHFIPLLSCISIPPPSPCVLYDRNRQSIWWMMCLSLFEDDT